MGRRPKESFFKKDIQMANSHMKRYSFAGYQKKTQIETTIRYYFNLSEWLSSERPQPE